MCVVCEIFANLRHLTPETLHKMELTRKTRKQSVFVDTYRCYYMSIVIWIFYMGTKFRDFITIPKKAKLKTCEIKGSLEHLKRCQKDGMEVPLYV